MQCHSTLALSNASRMAGQSSVPSPTSAKVSRASPVMSFRCVMGTHPA